MDAPNTPPNPPTPPAPAVPPPGRSPVRRWPVVLLVILLLGALGTLGALYAWQRGRTSDLERELDEARARGEEQAPALREDLTSAEHRAKRLRERLREALTDRAAESPAEATAGPELPDGTHLGFVSSVDESATPPRLEFDLAYWFVGEEASEAAVEDGVIEPGEELDMGYYIRNNNPRLRTLEASPAVQVRLALLSGDPEAPATVTLTRFAGLINEPPLRYEYAPHAPYWVTVQDGFVVEIEEQYVP